MRAQAAITEIFSVSIARNCSACQMPAGNATVRFHKAAAAWAFCLWRKIHYRVPKCMRNFKKNLIICTVTARPTACNLQAHTIEQSQSCRRIAHYVASASDRCTKITYGRKRTTGPLRRCEARARGRTQHQQMECKWIFLFVRPCTVNQRRSSSFVYWSSRFTLLRIVHAESAYMPLSHRTNDQRVYSWGSVTKVVCLFACVPGAPHISAVNGWTHANGSCCWPLADTSMPSALIGRMQAVWSSKCWLIFFYHSRPPGLERSTQPDSSQFWPTRYTSRASLSLRLAAAYTCTLCMQTCDVKHEKNNPWLSHEAYHARSPCSIIAHILCVCARARVNTARRKKGRKVIISQCITVYEKESQLFA